MALRWGKTTQPMVALGADNSEEGRLANVIVSAKATVDEILARVGSPRTGLHDDLLDLRNILKEGVPDD